MVLLPLLMNLFYSLQPLWHPPRLDRSLSLFTCSRALLLVQVEEAYFFCPMLANPRSMIAASKGHWCSLSLVAPPQALASNTQVGWILSPPKVCCFSYAPTKNTRNHPGPNNDHIHILLASNHFTLSPKNQKSPPILNPHMITLCKLSYI